MANESTLLSMADYSIAQLKSLQENISEGIESLQEGLSRSGIDFFNPETGSYYPMLLINQAVTTESGKHKFDLPILLVFKNDAAREKFARLQAFISHFQELNINLLNQSGDDPPIETNIFDSFHYDREDSLTFSIKDRIYSVHKFPVLNEEQKKYVNIFVFEIPERHISFETKINVAEFFGNFINAFRPDGSLYREEEVAEVIEDKKREYALKKIVDLTQEGDEEAKKWQKLLENKDKQEFIANLDRLLVDFPLDRQTRHKTGNLGIEGLSVDILTGNLNYTFKNGILIYTDYEAVLTISPVALPDPIKPIPISKIALADENREYQGKMTIAFKFKSGQLEIIITADRKTALDLFTDSSINLEKIEDLQNLAKILARLKAGRFVAYKEDQVTYGKPILVYKHPSNQSHSREQRTSGRYKNGRRKNPNSRSRHFRS